MKILICPDSFKGTMNASEAARIIASAYDNDKNVDCRTLPLADGGEGSIDIIKAQFSCSVIRRTALNPLGHRVKGFYLRCGHTAYIDIANVGGLNQLKEEERNPCLTSSYGTGQLISHAIAKQCKSIVLFLGGSATVDGGCGLMQGLCGKLYTQMNPLLLDEYVDIIDFQRSIQGVSFTVVTDVSNTLVGEHGAAKVFGPQKGADDAGIREIENAMAKWLTLLQKYTSTELKSLNGLGAAGGAAMPFVALNKQTSLINGFDFFNRLLDYKTAVDRADVIITGEGCIDNQTEMGKGPGRMAQMGKQAGKQVIGIGGIVKSQPANFDAVFSTCNKALSEHELQLQAKNNLLQASREVRKYLLD